MATKLVIPPRIPMQAESDPAPKPPTRMGLSSISRGRISAPTRLIVLGLPGVGKTTFGASAPNPIFLPTEDGTDGFDVARFPRPETFNEVLESVSSLTTENHDYKTLVIDSIDHVEPLIWRAVCEASRVTTIEDAGGGYGKGYIAAIDHWRRLLSRLEILRIAKRMTIIMLAHCKVSTYKGPDTEPYDRFQLKLQDGKNTSAAGLLVEWADDVLFARHEVFASKNEKTRSIRGVATGARVLHTSWSAAWEAKNRHNLPDVLPLSWDDYAAAVKADAPADPAALAAEIERKAAALGGEIENFSKTFLSEHHGDAAELAKLNDRLSAKMAEVGKE